jgi:hypothetical protein
VTTKHKPWFDEECSKLLDQMKQNKLQLLQKPRQMNGDNMNNVGYETSRTLREKNREYLKEKINVAETKSRNKNIRDFYMGTGEFQKGYQPRTNIA